MKYTLFFISLSLGLNTFAATKYDCTGVGVVMGKPEPLKTPKDSVQVQLKIERLVECTPQPAPGEEKKADMLKVGTSYNIPLQLIHGLITDKNEKLSFRVRWTCDKKCQPKKWEQILN